jgi:hypothetical protein
MKITIDRNGRVLTLKAHVPIGPDAARLGSMVLRSENVLYSHAPDTEYWVETNTDEGLEFRFRVSGLFAVSGVVSWATRLPQDIAFALEHDSRALAGNSDAIDRALLAPYPVQYFFNGVQVADVAALREAMCEPDVSESMGVFQLSTPALRVTDPCYQKTSSSAGVLRAMPGTWQADILIGDCDGRRQTKELRVKHDSQAADVFNRISEFVHVLTVGVDSCQCGFFDDARYPNGDPTVVDDPAAVVPAERIELETATVPGPETAAVLDSAAGLVFLDIPDDDDNESPFYADCRRLTSEDSALGGGILSEQTGVVSFSGTDGAYAVKALRDLDGMVLAATLVFLSAATEK